MDDLISTLQSLITDPENIKYLIPLAITAAIVLIWKAGRFVVIPVLMLIFGMVFKLRVSPGLCKDILDLLKDTSGAKVNGEVVQKGSLKVVTGFSPTVKVDDKPVDKVLTDREKKKVIKRAEKIKKQVRAEEREIQRNLLAEQIRNSIA